MNNDWLARLAPEHAPLVPAWWPPAPGWWVLALLLLDADIPQTARTVQNLLRRYALAMFGPDRVARLSGEAWLQFVAARGAASLGGRLGKSLLAASFGAKVTDQQAQDREAWCAEAERFLRRAVQDDERSGRT